MQCWMASSFCPGSWATFNGATLMAAEGSDDEPCVYSLVHHSHPSDSEPCQHCQTLVRKKKWSAKLFFLFSRENPWMADVHPNPLSNRKCPWSGGGGGDCYCLLAGVYCSNWWGPACCLARRVGSVWDVAVLETWSPSGAAFVSKPPQILTKEPKLGIEGNIGSLQHSIHHTVSRQIAAGLLMSQTHLEDVALISYCVWCMIPQKFKIIKICRKGKGQPETVYLARFWGKDPGYGWFCFRAETKSIEHFLIMESSFFWWRLHVLANVIKILG